MLITLLSTIVVLGVLIFVHELGHFTAAKLVDIEVPRFSIGLGPRMFGFTRGETEYVISWLPLGGYVKMAGMEEMEAIEGGSSKPKVSPIGTADDLGVEIEDKRVAGPRDFESKSLPARTLVISAGVLMNLVFAVLVFSASSFIWGVQVPPESRIGAVAEEYLPHGAEQLASLSRGTRITGIGRMTVNNMRDVEIAIGKVAPGDLEFRFDNHAPMIIPVPRDEDSRDSLIASIEPAAATPAIVGQVVKGTRAEQAGLQPGDRVLSADGTPVTSWQQLVSIVEKHAGTALPLTVQRGREQLALTVTPEAKTLRNKVTYGRVGIIPRYSSGDALPRQRPGFFAAIGHGFTRTWDVVRLTAGFLWDLVSGGASPRAVGGPITIGVLSGRVARAGLEAFLGFMALFSVNLAVLNLLPIPVLDGGHLMFLAVEAVRGRALSLEQRMRLSQVGFVIVVAIMVWAVANDVLRLFGL